MKQTLNDFGGASYTFNAVAKQITLSGIGIDLNETNIWSIINVTTGTIIQRLDKYLMGVSLVSNNVITLRGSTTGMSDTDKLVFIFDVDTDLSVVDTESSASLSMLKKIITLIAPLSTQDSVQRQRVVVEGNPQTIAAYSVPANSADIPTGGVPTLSASATYWQPVRPGPVDPRFTNIEQARMSYALGIRANLSFT